MRCTFVFPSSPLGLEVLQKSMTGFSSSTKPLEKKTYTIVKTNNHYHQQNHNSHNKLDYKKETQNNLPEKMVIFNFVFLSHCYNLRSGACHHNTILDKFPGLSDGSVMALGFLQQK